MAKTNVTTPPKTTSNSVSTTQGGTIPPTMEVPVPQGNVRQDGFVPANMQVPDTYGADSPGMGFWVGTGADRTAWRIPSAEMESTASLANRLDVKYDEDYIRKKLNNATNRQFARDRQAYRDSHNQMLQDFGTAGKMTEDAIRKSIATGRASGTDATASMLSARLSNQDMMGQAAGQSRNDINLLERDYAAQLAANQNTAYNTSFQNAMAIGGIAQGNYGIGVQDRAASMGLAAAVDANRRDMAAQNHNADSNLAGQRYTADSNLAGQLANARAQQSYYDSLRR